MEALHTDFSEVELFASELAVNPKVVSAGVRPLLVEWATKGAKAMQNRLPDPAPVGEHLRASVTADRRTYGRIGARQGVAYTEFGPEWFVARFREFGTVHEPPRPFVDASAGDIAVGFYQAMQAVTSYL